ncbi:hypothetical protein NL460_28175, partial [Klebsiella pneumoniae]|nr:hypothetical protein [Klebsiella pneumoniae]
MNKYLLSLGLALSTASAMADQSAGPASPVAKPAKAFPHISLSSDDGQSTLDIGGALRMNYRHEDWDTTENNGRFLFDTFRL